MEVWIMKNTVLNITTLADALQHIRHLKAEKVKFLEFILEMYTF